jgi:hypothetical protein
MARLVVLLRGQMEDAAVQLLYPRLKAHEGLGIRGVDARLRRHCEAVAQFAVFDQCLDRGGELRKRELGGDVRREIQAAPGGAPLLVGPARRRHGFDRLTDGRGFDGIDRALGTVGWAPGEIEILAVFLGDCAQGRLSPSAVGVTSTTPPAGLRQIA